MGSTSPPSFFAVSNSTLAPCLQNHTSFLVNLSTDCTRGCQNESCNATSHTTGNPYILVWYQQLIYIILFVSMVIVAAGGNVIVIWIVLAHKRMRTVTNYFLVNLAIADALMSILNTLFNFVYMLQSHWPFGREYCKISTFIASCTIAASVFTFMAISIDRYMAIIHPLNPRMGARVVLGVVAVIWLLASALALPQLLYSTTYTWTYDDNTYRTVCFMQWPDGVYGTSDFVYNIVFMILTYFAPLTALGVAYFRVGQTLWGSQAIGEMTAVQMDNVKSKRRIVKMLIVVVIIFGVCWLPQHVYFLATNQNEQIQSRSYAQHLYLAIYWLAMSNSMYNPIIYCWMNARFRRGFKLVFRWLPCITIQPGDITGTKTTVLNRVSMSETTKYGGYMRNGSMMHTCVETLDDHPLSPTSAMMCHSKTPSTHAQNKRDDPKLHTYKPVTMF